MRKILSTSQIRDLDAYTIQHRPISSIDLMENACRAVHTWLLERYPPETVIGVVCGTGNNGGDGLGVARMLHDSGYSVFVWVVKSGGNETTDFKTNLERLKGKIEVDYVSDVISHNMFDHVDVVIDAIFGSGLSRPLAGTVAELVEGINAADVERIAIDLPSGLMADKPSEGVIVKADHTLAFQVPKLVFFFPQYHNYLGTWHLLEIGLHRDYLKQLTTPYFYFQRKDVRKILHTRSKFDHKGKYGHVLLIAGGYGKMGAAVLATKAALRAGLGLLTVNVPPCGYDILQISVPEAMTVASGNERIISETPSLNGYSVIGIGPGIGQEGETVQAFRKILEQAKVRMVIDADALNILAANRELLPLVPPDSVLTPHPKEFERLVGPWKNDFARLEKQKQLARDLRSVVVLKGAYTSVALPDGTVIFNSSGNPGMAKGGCGDVLTGILTGLMAQSYNSADAVKLGVFLHGFAGDLAAYEKGMNSLTASDLIDFLPGAFKQAG